MRRVTSWLLAAAAVCALTSGTCSARVFQTREQALREVFPEADSIIPHDLFLTAAQREAVERQSGAPLGTDFVTLYEARCKGRVLGVAALDVQQVRTMPQTLLVAVSPGGTVLKLVMCAFAEPDEYLPTIRWFRQFEGKTSGARLRVGGDVAAVAGCTLTSQAVARAVKRTLALSALLAPAAKGER